MVLLDYTLVKMILKQPQEQFMQTLLHFARLGLNVSFKVKTIILILHTTICTNLWWLIFTDISSLSYIFEGHMFEHWLGSFHILIIRQEKEFRHVKNALAYCTKSNIKLIVLFYEGPTYSFKTSSTILNSTCTKTLDCYSAFMFILKCV